MPNLMVHKIGNTIGLCMFLVLLGCSQPNNYAPVKTVNEAFNPDGVIAPRSKIQRNSAKTEKPETKKKDSKNHADSMPLNPYVNGSSADIDTQPTGVVGVNKRDERDKKLKLVSPKSPKAKPDEVNRAVVRSKKEGLNIFDSNPVRQGHRKDVNAVPSPIVNSKNVIKERSISIQIKLESPVDIKKNNEKKSIISNNNKKVLKLNFEWPVSGKVVRNFGQSDSKGIDISGKNGQKVRAAESGKAVYCGSGLAGYGNLVIIKHNQDYLSAYAHNRRLSVKEGQMVDKGQPIGELGLAGFKKSILHFEIRKNGKAINPLTLLPKF